MKVILPDETELELDDGATGLDAARAIGPRLAEQAVLVRLDNGDVRDLRDPLDDGARIQILTPRDREDPDALYVLRHSTAHLLAEAVQRLYPGTKIAIGPPIADGFYYDFDFPKPISDDDLARLEDEINREIKEGRSWERSEVGRDEARQRFEAEGEPYKAELVDDAEGTLTLYQQGDFVDLCRGPHLQNTAPIKAVKLTSLAGAYWRGDSDNKQLTRVYGTAFYSKKDLDAHLERLEQAKLRDHRRLGKQLDLFHFADVSPGSPFWHPKGMVIWNALEDLRRAENARRGYEEVRTPLIYDVDVWKTSGHWDNYRDNMYFFDTEAREYGLKPMNCPGHCFVFSDHLRSYRELPLRLGEAGLVHRHEASGVLHGLLRVRHITQDDAHIFCTHEQTEDEVLGCLDYAFFLYGLFDFRVSAELSTRPEKRIGADEHWDRAEDALRGALERQGLEYELNEGDGAFYGPKIDLHVTDALERSWQLGTIQLDFQMPERFELSYIGSDNTDHTPVMIHRALLGSLERFIGIVIEHTGGDLPTWIAPVQARVLPVAEDHLGDAKALCDELVGLGVRADLDVASDTLGKRIRSAEMERIPYVLVFGDKEAEGVTLAVRERGKGVQDQARSAALEAIGNAAKL
ncbi:MAG: threonine--tRNA ligase [Gaiellaceae bacterium]